MSDQYDFSSDAYQDVGADPDEFTAPYLRDFAQLPGAQVEDSDGDGLIDTVHLDSDGDTVLDMTEHVDPSDHSTTLFDATGDGIPDVIAHGSDGTFDTLTFPDDGSTLPLP
ncbi:hypothetical protein ACM01_03865 [Streptomyces viridochromogenes]|uniref:Uncharacterized protein n=1 Tax=Streptomyces viridochromogenes TaxID=1938 RepID=A0A0J7ZLZ4_STRVR|nr:hypothetical protein [Streptomyces viridochromogenes]KMS76959.1 hypothetical protein ACM01_03865 [Streptomyces viridochromogenes]